MIINSLSTGTAVFPDVPVLAQALLFSQLPDLGARYTLVVAIIPLSYVFSDFNASVTRLRRRIF